MRHIKLSIYLKIRVFMKIFASVLIPAYNEERDIKKCLDSIKHQDYRSDQFEVIVIDNGSSDATKQIAVDAGVQVVDAKSMLIGGVRNEGARLSKGDVLAYLDADCVAPPDWLSNGVSLLIGSDSVGAVGGRCSVADNATWIQRAWGWKNPESTEKQVDILSTASFFLKKSIFNEVGGFNETLTAGEDTEISMKIIKSGRILILSPSVDVIHLGYPSSMSSFFRRQIWQSTDYLRTIKNKKDLVFLLVHFFLASFFIGLVSLFFSAGIYIFSFFIGFTVFSAISLASYRHIKMKRGKNFSLLFQSFFLNYLYLLGRSVGLIKSYLRTIFR
ncbi:glycosyltransferase [Marinobacter sp. GN3S48]|uniref:glycosyltransferase n=1 Tax=Marinobacter sp. GN3S48 TaxID=3382302 RepID=UPI00387AD22B